jgi:DNA-binding CsgD family transcriptional regulator
MVRKSWSFKEDRRLLELAKSKKALEQIAKAMDRSPERIRERAKRLGVSIRSQAASRATRNA